jgi:hypothetical protein
MRSFFYLITSVFIISSITGCDAPAKKEKRAEEEKSNQDNKEPKELAEIDCKTLGSFFISEADGQRYIQRFKDIYSKSHTNSPDKRFVDSFWVDGCLIRSLKMFLTKNQQYDGVNIYSTFDKPIFARNKVNIVIAPSILDPATGSKKHLSKYDDAIDLIYQCNPKDRNFNLGEQESRGDRRKFEKDIRKERVAGDPSSAELKDLSRGIWFSRCVIDSVSKYLSDPVLNLSGVYLYNAVYDKFIPGTDQESENQSTFIIVLTSFEQGKHKPRWDVIQQNPGNKIYFMQGGYNHGQLCPRICD